jgi:hypothetical protein
MTQKTAVASAPQAAPQTLVRQTSDFNADAMAVFSQQLGGIRQRFAQMDQQRHQPLFAAPESRQATAAMSVDDWDVLFRAVRTRLRLTLSGVETLHFDGSAAPLQSSVLECVDALDQLHMMLHHVLASRHQA